MRKPTPDKSAFSLYKAPKPSRKIPFVLGGICLFGIATYCGALYGRYTKDRKEYLSNPDSHVELRNNTKEIYNQIAKKYDSLNSRDEWLLGITKQRRKLVSRASGDVLDLACGTGLNVDFYDPERVKSIVFLDQSSQMLTIARERWNNRPEISDKVQAKFLVGDAEDYAAEHGEGKFDFVVQTNVLCSCQDPGRLVKATMKLVKPGGRIIMMDHGKSSHDWVNKILDTYATSHRMKWGCQWNLDIERILKSGGIPANAIKRRLFGTVYEVDLEKGKLESS